MKIKWTSLLAMFLTVTLCLSCFGISAFAAETQTQYGLEATLVTDKESYKANEEIHVTVTVKNTNDFEVKNVSIESLLPEELTIKGGSSSTKTVDLEPGETLTLSFTAVKEKEETSATQAESQSTEPTETEPVIPSESETVKPSETETVKPSESETVKPSETEPQKPTQAPTTEQTTQGTTTPLPTEPTAPATTTEGTTLAQGTTGTQSTTGGIIGDLATTFPKTTTPADSSTTAQAANPDTGDSMSVKTLAIAVIALLAVIAIVMILMCKYKKRTTKLVSLVMCVAVAATAVTGVSFFTAEGVDDGRKSFTVEKTILIDDEETILNNNIKYTEQEQVEVDLGLVIDQKDFNTTESIQTLTGYFKNDAKVTSMTWTLAAEIDDESISDTGEAIINGNHWTIDNVRLKPDNNKITVTAKTSDNKVSVKSVNIVYDVGTVYELDQSAVVQDEDTKINYVNNIILIFFSKKASEERKQEIITSINGEVVGQSNIIRQYQVKVPSNDLDGLKKICYYLKSTYEEEIVEATFDTAERIATDGIPSDPWAGNTIFPEDWNESKPNGSNWGLEAIRVPSAWDYNNRFQHINIGIVDIGFDTGHEDLKDILRFPNKKSREENNAEGHGTHVAGIIGAKPNNNKGITGILWDTTLYCVDYQPTQKQKQQHKSNTNVLSGLLLNVAAGCKVVNYSLGLTGNLKNGETSYSKDYINDVGKITALYMQILFDEGYDFVVVQSSGNGTSGKNDPSDDNEKSDPNKVLAIDAINNGLFASVTEKNIVLTEGTSTTKQDILDRIIIVGNAKKNDDGNYQQAVNSNGGKQVSICAPGTDIYSTTVGGLNGSYEKRSGTSMAAPHVTGVCGLVWSVNPNFTGAQVKKIVCGNTSDKVYDNPDGKHTTNDEYQLVNAQLAVEDAIRKTDAIGDGSIENPYQVSNADQLNAIRYDLDAHYIQTADIDLSQYSNWEPIGYAVYNGSSIAQKGGDFNGSFDGNGFRIDNLKINISSVSDLPSNYSGDETEEVAVGLFGVIGEEGNVKNVSLDNTDIKIAMGLHGISVGAVAGSAYLWGYNKYPILENCTVSGKIDVACYGANVGGIVGVGQAKDSSNHAEINAKTTEGSLDIGGIVGTTGVIGGHIINCVNENDISGISGSSYAYVGGISGREGNIASCRNYGNIHGETLVYETYSSWGGNCNVGGINGGSQGDIESCINEGTVSSMAWKGGSSYAGGISGYYGSGGWGKMSRCYNMSSSILSRNEARLNQDQYELRYAYAGRICGKPSWQQNDNYSIDTCLVNDAIPTEEIGPSKANGGSMTKAEIEKAIQDLGFDLPNQRDLAS